MTEERFKKLEKRVNMFLFIAVCIIAPQIIGGTIVILGIFLGALGVFK